MPSDRSDEDLKYKLDRLTRNYEDGVVTRDEFLRFKRELTSQATKQSWMSAEELDSHHLKEIAQQARHQTELLESIRWWVVFFGVGLGLLFAPRFCSVIPGGGRD